MKMLVASFAAIETVREAVETTIADVLGVWQRDSSSSSMHREDIN